MFTVEGMVYQTPAADRFTSERVVMAVGTDGVITDVQPSGSTEASALIRQATSHITLDANQRLLPGLIDLHVHAPQWPQLGTGLDLPLERWLFDYTFPLEARYADPLFAKRVWNHMVPTLLAHGTTTAVYYGTVDEAATLSLAETCLTHGQRAFVGRVAMDHPEGTPEWYRDPDVRTALERSARSIEAIHDLAGTGRLVRPILTPRFIPACTDALLDGMGELSARTGVRVQTHCSESDWEHNYVLDRYGETDTEALSRFGLATHRSILAHCDHMTDTDLDLTASLGAAVAHCPLSNAYFGNAVFPVRKALSRGVRVGLGTDIAGGAHPGLLHQSAMAVTASRLLEDGVDARLPVGQRGVADSRLDTVMAFWLATVGGATALGLPAGLLSAGHDERTFEKIVRLASPADITQVWVNGQAVR
jgi:guanine deaminase